MARFAVTSLLVVVVLAAAAVEGRDVITVNENDMTMPTNRKLLGEARPFVIRPINGTNSINAVIEDNSGGRMLTGEDQCQRTCDQVRFKKMCRSLTRLPGVTTPQALLQASVRVALNKARQGKRRVDAYAAEYHGGNPLQSMLETCSQGYGQVADSLAEAQRLIDAGQVTGVDLNRQLSSVIDDALECNNAFEERPEITPPFPGTLKNVYRVTDNVLNIAYVVKHV